MPVRQLAAAYGARTGASVTVTADTAGGVQERMEAGEAFDLVIGTQAVLDRLTRDGKVAAAHADLAQMVAGISARKGAPAPGLADSAQLKASLLSAHSIAYVDPAKGGITGVFFLSQADRLGIGDAVRAKAVLRPNGTGVADAVARGEADYGVTLISEMLPNTGVTVWPLPQEVQMTTIYAAALSVRPGNGADARAMLEELRGPQGRDAARQAGLLPVSH
jgi:molybdate transport system substrate-binding protein